MAAVSDQEIDQLYAERYRLDQLFQNTPDFRDSLENSSAAADSHSGLSLKSHKSQRSRSSHGSQDEARTPQGHQGDHHLARNESGRSPRATSPHRTRDEKGHRNSPATSSPRWHQPDGLLRTNSGRKSPRDEPAPVRRPHPLMQPGFSYIYPNAEGGAPGEKIPVRRYSFLGHSKKRIPDTALPFKGKLEYFDRLSRGSTPEPAVSPFTQGHRKLNSPHRINSIFNQNENKLAHQGERSSARPVSDTRPPAKLHARPPDSPSGRPQVPGRDAHHAQNINSAGTPAANRKTVAENCGLRPTPPPPQVLFENRLSKKDRNVSDARETGALGGEAPPVHRRLPLLQSVDGNRGSSPSSSVPGVKWKVHKDNSRDERVSDASENISKMSSFADLRKNEDKNLMKNEEKNFRKDVEKNIVKEEERNLRQEKEKNFKKDELHNFRKEENKNIRKEDEKLRHHRENVIRNISVSAEINPETRRRHLDENEGGSPYEDQSSNSKSRLKRHVSSPAVQVSRRSLAVGQSKISDSVLHITDSMWQLRRTLSKRVGRSVSRSIGKSIVKKYKRQYNDDLNDRPSDDARGPSSPLHRPRQQQLQKQARPTLSDTFTTLRRSHAFSHSGTHYHMLFGDVAEVDRRNRREQEPKTISDIHRFIHSNDTEGDSRSHKSSSLPHPVDASVRGEVSLQEKYPEKFWTFTTSVVLPDYEPKQAYPDHPERDSLDGHLPGSSHGTGNPPPPPAPPSPPPATAGRTPGTGFTKGPNAKNKKHKKLKNEADEAPAPGEDHPEKKEKKDKSEKSKDRDMEAGGGYRPKTEPYTYLWVVLSGMYGKLVVLMMLAFCLTEVLDNKVLPFTFQGIFLMYLYVGSIVAIMCIYVSVIIDNCPSITASKENLTKHEDPEAGSITSFGTLKRAHISRSKTSRTSFYLRVGALVFGLGTLIFNGLEIAMHSTMKSECVKDIVFAHPILQALFTFLQMHFLFVNSEVIVEKFGQVARFGFMHLVATNVAIWIRMVVWESAIVWIEDTYATGSLVEIPEQAEQVLRLYTCFQNNTLGRLWTDAQPYLFPFLVQYSLIAAAVTYIMWRNVGKEKLRKLAHLGKSAMEDTATLDKRGVRKGHWKVDCRSASKGLFLGLLCLVGGIVILIIFFVMKEQEDFKIKMFWICSGTQMIILGLAVVTTIIGFLQIPKLSISTSKPLDLDRLLLSSTIIGVYLFAVFGMIVGGINYTDSEYLATFCVHAMLLLQVSLQDMLVAEASRRTCTSRYQMLTKPGRQVITFLLFANVTLWILDTFMTHTSVSQQFQFGFYGVLAWGIISRISLPLLILYRFHSAVILVEIWKNTYRTKAD
ncbi:LOW QUALITY PROTEIN: uncharacterized protein [Panulirus ornatus]|uniref:LOW QUALITY PROTEIN: uncharacterized protein n=1 Tax=Panulirus ornatus TaxID=150431 RepID=UPI003A839066